MNNIVYITGHKNPDTDSICSSIAYSEFKNKTKSISSKPIRLGNLNRETKFVLDYFDVKEPELITTVKTQISDLNIDKAVLISPQTSLKMSWHLMKKNNVRTLPVIDENDKLLGLVSLSNLTSIYMDVWDNHILSKSKTKLINIIDTLCGKLIHDGEKELKGKITVITENTEHTKDTVNEGDIVICGNREETQLNIIESKASLLILSGNNNLSDKVITSAKKYKCSIISTPYDTFTASRLIVQSIPVSHVMTRDKLISFSIHDYVDEVKDIMLETRFRSYPVLDEESKVIGTISRYHLIGKNKKKVILVDHNERTQSVDGLEHAEILEIIDHHRVGDVQTGLPIYFRNEPVGSTATIISSLFFENGIMPSKKVAGLMCAAIISDTLLLKSPTSTIVDKMALKRLSEIANINVENFAKKMFKAGTSLEGITPEQIFNQDFKSFNINNLKIGVSQISTIYIESFVPIKDLIIKLMNDKCKSENFDLLILMVTDILNGGSELIVAGEYKFIVEKAFNVKLKDPYVYLADVMSRKKQVIPPLTSAINSLNNNNS